MLPGVISRNRLSGSRLVLAGALCVAAATAALTAQYSLTVNKDRLINAANEPQNWLLMNGDYGSLRYSRLTQINRENVKNMLISFSNTQLRGWRSRAWL